MILLKRINPLNFAHLTFLYGTRFHPEVTKTLFSKIEPTFEEHVDYIRGKDMLGHLFFLITDTETVLFFEEAEEREVEKFVGYCQAHYIKDGVWEAGWVVHPLHQGKGYGTKSVELLLAEMRLMDIEVVELEVLKENTRAVSIYEKAGFKKLEDRSTETYWRMAHSILNPS